MVFLSLFDRRETILWLSPAPLPPWTLADIVGVRCADTLTGCDRTACIDAFARLWATGEPQRFDARVRGIGVWRTSLRRVTGVRGVAAAGEARQLPRGVAILNAEQRRICELLARGLASKAIAHELDVARSTVDNRRSEIAAKIGIRSHSLVAWCGENAEWLS